MVNLRILAEALVVTAVVVVVVVAGLLASHLLVALFQVVPASQAQFGAFFVASKHVAQDLAH